MAPFPPLSNNRNSSWKADASQGHDVAEISSQPRRGMTFLSLRPWRNRNAIDEDGRVWYDDLILAISVWLSTPAVLMAGVAASTISRATP
ncbi:hypothetical protein Pyn_07635 [Prunus yedoensis var. nudiflora]|uniref:Uncharacterized protein n=1 Tax=Prunus yedoensis var. nudiflora TaxID=2094558 RepID=A0A314YRX9_PRUYE|nr:hypothetical protein Pyn_41121 [Prunus yedoensis var. nudiflora]PQQ07528.1 hypothetical protein Pyn_07635 [Prunus yedoensis var. nudiflora]